MDVRRSAAQEKLAESQRKAEAAKRLLEDPLLVDAFEQIETAINDGFNKVKSDDFEGFRELAINRDLLKRFKRILTQAVNTNKVVKADFVSKQRFIA